MNGKPRTLDVSRLPTVGFGTKDVSWWATVAFIVIEGTTLALAMSAYLYLRKNFDSWPPAPTRDPDLLIPTINLILILGTIIPMAIAGRAAPRMDLSRIRTGLTVAVLLSLMSVILRFYEFRALNTRWDDHAYGSAAWAVLGLHSTLLLVDFLETAAIMVLMYLGPVERKHFSDVSDASFYQYFLSLAYVPVYVLLFLSPRWM